MTINKQDYSDILKTQECNNINSLHFLGEMMSDDFMPLSLKDYPEEKKQPIIQQFRKVVEQLEFGTEVEMSFKEFILESVKTIGKERTEKIYDLYRVGWIGIGRSADFTGIYKEVFIDRASVISGLAGYLETIEDVAEKVEQHSAETRKAVVKPASYVTDKPQAKIAYSSTAIDYVEENLIGEDETIVDVVVVGKQKASEIKDAPNRRNTKLLDYDEYTVGTELKLMIPADYMETLVPIYDEYGRRIGLKKFHELNLEPNSQEFIDNLPIVIIDADGDIVGDVHTPNWYRVINAVEGESTEAAITQTRHIRSKVLEAGIGNTVTAKVTGNYGTTFRDLIMKDENGEDILIPLNEAHPDPMVMVPIKDYTSSNDRVDLMTKTGPFKGKLINSEELVVGQTYEIRRFYWENGEPTYIALRTTPTTLSEDAVESVASAIEFYLTSQLDNSKTAYEAMKNVSKERKINIFDVSGIKDFLKQFIYLSSTNDKYSIQSNDTEEDKRRKGNSLRSEIMLKTNPKTLELSKGYFITFSDDNIVIGNVFRPLYKYNTGDGKEKYVNIFSMSPRGMANSPAALKMLPKILEILRTEMLPNALQSTNWEFLDDKMPVVALDRFGKTKILSPNYHTYMSGQLRSNVKSYVLPNGKGITCVQPIITFSLEEDVDIPFVPTSSKEVVKEEVEGTTPQKTSVTEEKSTEKNLTPDEVAEKLMRETLGDSTYDMIVQTAKRARRSRRYRDKGL